MRNIIAGLALALISTSAMALSGTDLIEAGNSGMCVAHKGGKAVLARCNGGDAAQRWVFLLNGEIRPAKAMGKCLDVTGSRFKNGTKVIVYKCHGKRNQQWESGKRGLLRTAKNRCLDVPASKFRAGRQLIIWKCNKKQRNQQFGAHKFGRVTNRQLAALGLPAYAKCLERSGRTERNGKCYIDFKPPVGKPKDHGGFIPWLASLRWGFRTGGGNGWDTGPSAFWTMDIGQTYSLDRCSHAHDAGRWSEDSSCPLTAAFSHCLRQVRPINRAEERALRMIIGPLKLATTACAIIGQVESGTLPPNDRGGERDTGW
ncbi:MAG: RICIN domain-containing protein [Pseudomonadota bacterium]